MDANEVGRRLAQRHVEAGRCEIDPVRSLLNYAESPQADDWTLRSGLVRLAQPEPERVGDLLQVLRRLDAVLGQVTRDLQRNPACCDAALVAGGADDRDGSVPSSSPDGPLLAAIAVDLGGFEGPAAEAIGDIRVADLGRAAAVGLDEAALAAGYRSVSALDDLEERALPLVAVAARFEQLARVVAVWAAAGPEGPPTDLVDQVTAETRSRLDQLGVPEETGPPPRGARGGRG